MFVYNFSLNTNKLGKIILTTISLFVLIILIVSIYKIFFSEKFKVNDTLNSNNVTEITTSNYTNILKSVHENIDEYIGKKINFTGYVYRVSDLNKNEFVLARDMVINSNYQTVVVGFLCNYDDAPSFTDGTWVSVTGEIIKGYYHGDMPVIDINDIKLTNKPNDEYVYPPDDFYIPTSSIY